MIARHLTADLYGCKDGKLSDMPLCAAMVEELVKVAGFHLLHADAEAMEEGHFVLLMAFKEGHLALHAYVALGYIAADIFLCEPDAEPEGLFKSLRKFFRPEKFRTTFLKRGDFADAREIRPKIKTRVAPLRRIHNTGAKVMRLLARRER